MGAEGDEPGLSPGCAEPVATQNASMQECGDPGSRSFGICLGVHETFAKGTRSTWTVVEGRLMRFFIQSD